MLRKLLIRPALASAFASKPQPGAGQKVHVEPISQRNPGEESHTRDDKKGIRWVFVASSGLLGFACYYFDLLPHPPVPVSTPQPKPTPPSVIIPSNVNIGGSWTLINEKGETETDQSYKGQFVVYYFGYTNCPEVCPTSLRKMAKAIDLLKAKTRIPAFLFISLDPERDSPDTVGRYTKLFHTDIHALVVPAPALPQFLKQFKLFSTKMPTEGGYNLDHTNYMYLMSPEGKLLTVLGYDLTAEAVAARIEQFTS